MGGRKQAVLELQALSERLQKNWKFSFIFYVVQGGFNRRELNKFRHWRNAENILNIRLQNSFYLINYKQNPWTIEQEPLWIQDQTHQQVQMQL